jgi:hypothetical protein
MERLAKGTKEFLVIPVTDTQNNLQSSDYLMLNEVDALNLSVTPGTLTAATYDLYTGDDEATEIITGQACVIDGMKILPLIDTTALEGPYDLFVTFEALPEIPRLGPFRFRVDD